MIIPPLSTEEPTHSKWYHNIWFVMIMLFIVVGPFGLPLVWKNPRFSQRGKVAMTIAVILYTLWLIYLTLQAIKMIMGGHLQE
ncbi:MAG: hypothetical protein HY201_01445 [Nitrospirae bacterium]|nr:hypothetical protein [Candidatus Troglogloeales bacterium]